MDVATSGRTAAPNLNAFDHHFESSIEVKAACAAVFDHLDDFNQFGEHMTRSSWMMAGSAMRYEFDEARGRATGAAVRLLGSVLGIRLEIEERVTERAPPYRKSWETVGQPRMIVVKSYRMGFELTQRDDWTHLRVFIDYAMPDRSFSRVLGRLLGSVYARWCVASIVNGAALRFGA